MKYTIAKPKMMDNIHTAKHNPNAIISILILIAICIAANIVSSLALMVYLLAEPSAVFMQGSFYAIMNYIMDVFATTDFALMNLYLMVFIILFVIIEVRFIEKRPLSTLGLSRKRFAVKYLAGFGVGALLITLNMIPGIISELGNISYNGFTPLVLAFLLGFIIQTASEEILFRGYLLTSLGHKIGMFWAAVLSSFIFALFHLINGDATILGIAAVFFIGMFLSFYMIRTNNIWGAFGIHAAWNFVQGCVTKLEIGPMRIDYAIIQVGDPSAAQDFGIVGDPMHLITIATILIATCLVLFVGKNKIVRKAENLAEENQISPIEA